MAYSIKKREPVGAAIARIVREQIDGAGLDLKSADCAAGIHEARKRFKNIRSVLRLVRSELGDAYAAENAWYRDAGAQLARLRAADAMLETFDELFPRGKNTVLDAVERAARAAIERRREDELLAIGDLTALRDRLLASLAVARKRVDDWPIERDGFDALERGIRAVYRHLRTAHMLVNDEANDENLHELRKLVRHHWCHVRLLAAINPGRMKKRQHRFRRLAEALGNCRDLGFLVRFLASDGQFASLLPEAKQARAGFASDSLRLSERLCRKRAKKLVDDWRKDWKRWRRTS